jgi:hemolysin activation/secretion protein
MRNKVFLGLSQLWILTVISTAHAQAPSAGAFQQNIDQDLRQNFLPQNTSRELIPIPQKIVSSEVLFTVVSIKFTGNTLLANTQIELLMAPYLNKPINFSDLQALSSLIEAAYRNAGGLARVVIPPQEIENEILILQIEESLYGVTRIEGSSTRIKPQQVIHIINATQASGKLVEISRLDRGILLADDLPGVIVGGILSQGSIPLATDLVATISDEPLLFGSVQADNTGPTSIGAYRLLGSAGINSPLGVGDLLSATYLYSQGSNYGRLGYTLPVGSDGVRVGVNGSTMDYRLVSSHFASLEATGTSSTAGAEINYPVIRSRSANLYIGANADYRQFSNSNLYGVNQYSVMDFSVSMNGNLFDTIWGAGANNGSLILTSGNLTNGNTNLDSSFIKLRYNLNRTQTIANNLSLYVSFSGQATSANLDSSEMFYLGGAYGVRAYPTNEGGGSQAQLATIELRKTIEPNIGVVIFYDYGTTNSYIMQGSGLSLAWKPQRNIDLKIIWSQRIGSNPNPTSTGTYQDGTSGNSQFWFISSVAF